MDGTFTAADFTQILLDIVDEEWLADCLSDDDIEIPEEHQLPADDVDDANEADAKAKAETTWTDLALQQFMEEAGGEGQS